MNNSYVILPYLDFNGRCDEALADGESVNMPSGKTFFSPAFGLLSDKFGVGWMVYVERQQG